LIFFSSSFFLLPLPRLRPCSFQNVSHSIFHAVYLGCIFLWECCALSYISCSSLSCRSRNTFPFISRPHPFSTILTITLLPNMLTSDMVKPCFPSYFSERCVHQLLRPGGTCLWYCFAACVSMGSIPVSAILVKIHYSMLLHLHIQISYEYIYFI
jgi:hypothetical protein